MTDHSSPTRRQALFGAAGLGLSVSFMGRAAGAAETQGRRIMIVLVCRGGMDGLSVAPPVGDPDYAALRGPIAMTPDQALRLDATFGLHPALSSVHALARQGQARIAPAVATPDRARSHFEAQDVLESGAGVTYGAASGWLNRSLAALSPASRSSALSVGATAPLILRGPNPASSWSPGKGADSAARLPTVLQDLYKTDPAMSVAFARGLQTEAMAQAAMSGLAPPLAAEPGTTAMSPPSRVPSPRQGREAARKLGLTVAGFLNQAGGPQVVAISLDGFDTHAGQPGLIATRLGYMDALIDGLHGGLGEAWRDTVLVAATEFGRTARVNGTNGTDHGTASTALVLGGGLKRGGVVGDWPTLKANALYENRDLAPTLDMRSLFKGVLRDHMGVDRAVLDKAVFPDSADAAPLVGLV